MLPVQPQLLVSHRTQSCQVDIAVVYNRLLSNLLFPTGEVSVGTVHSVAVA
jgi:hypothetical protein